MHKAVRYQFFSALAILSTLILAGSSISTTAAQRTRGQNLNDSPDVIYRAVYIEGGSPRHVMPSHEYFSIAVKTAEIQVNYLPSENSWPADAKAAFEFAKGIWETSLSSTVPIVIDATWENLTAKYGNPYILGGASAADYYRDFTGAPFSNTWYPLALANKIYGADIDPKNPDIEASFNSAFSSWYFGKDGNPPGVDKYDFVSVVLHEIGHGLGFSGSMVWSGGNGSWGYGSNYPFIYDKYVVNGYGQSLLNISIFPNSSTALGSQLTGGSLFFNGPHAVAANGGSQGPKLYAPPTWEQGSSYSHLDEATYAPTSEDALMTPSLANDEVIHVPGPMTMGIFEDIGWSAPPVPQYTATYTQVPSTEKPTSTPTQASPTAKPTAVPTPSYDYYIFLPTLLSGSLPSLTP